MEVCGSSRHVPGTACCFLNRRKTSSTHVFSALYYIYLSFNVNFLLLHNFGKTDLSAALTKQLLTEWSCCTGILIETPFFSCTGCWDGAPVGSLWRPPVPQTCWRGGGDSGKDFISTTGLAKRGVLPRPDISVKVTSLKNPMWTEGPLNQASKIYF